MGCTPVNVFLPQVTRIPILGPAPFNTLVCCGAVGAVGVPGAGAGFLTRAEVSFGTNFILAGFDQRVPPQFQHSTAAWLAGTGPAEDDTWLYAVDAITGAGFTPTGGEFFVNVDVAVMYAHIPDQFQHGSLDYQYFASICSYVLVYEPPPPTPPAGQARTRFVQRPLQMVRPGDKTIGPPAVTTKFVPFVEPGAEAIFRAPTFASPVAPGQSLKCRCQCDCCRKRKCVRQNCKQQNCTCTCSCCQR